ncbi:DUF3822 family protein [uncultured Flavobacterium sp.]|uniref:DUF3822 family protein n=1 Tax=uncultured Flavobacterium sp. TaxID=165435 RepID=UPI0030ED3432|tara:strand:- start:1376 stop:2188 length:813 start_codon:yes stop_codon:yes gene_type:complete
MVVTSNDITQRNYKKLSIQVSLSGLSFCVFDTITNKILVHNSVTFKQNEVIDGLLWNAFIDNSILTKTYDEIIVLHDNNINTFVPKPLFDKDNIASYLQYNVKVFETDFFAVDELNNYEVNNIYVPFVNINNFLLDQFESFEYKNTNTLLVQKILDKSKNIDEKQVFIHFQENHFEIVVVRNQELLLFNSFEYNSPEDFIYYILFTFEQLQLNPEMIRISLFGNISKEDSFYKIAYKFIRNCNLLDVSNQSKTYDVAEKDMLHHFILFNS